MIDEINRETLSRAWTILLGHKDVRRKSFCLWFGDKVLSVMNELLVIHYAKNGK